MADGKPAEQSEVKKAPIQPINGEQTTEQRRAALEELRKRIARRPLEFTAPAGWVARWARRVDEQEMARLEWKGYRVVKEEPGQPKRYQLSIKCREDGTYIVGDVILVEIPKEIDDFLRMDEKEKEKMLLEEASGNFISEAMKEGIPTFERDQHGRTISTKNMK